MSYAKVFDTLLTSQRSSGVTLAGGKVYFYVPGTNTLKPIYSTRNKTVAANPFTLSANGTATLYGDGLYDVQVKTAAGVNAAPLWEDVLIMDSLNDRFIFDFSSEFVSLADAATNAAFEDKTIVITSPHVVTTAITWPDDRELRFEKGGYVTFTGSGALTGLTSVKPENFGPNTDPGTTDMGTSLTRAIAALSGGGILHLGPYTYRSTVPLVVDTVKVSIIGSGTGKGTSNPDQNWYLTNLKYDGAPTENFIKSKQQIGVKWEGFGIDANSKANVALYVDRLQHSTLDVKAKNSLVNGVHLTTEGTTANDVLAWNIIRLGTVYNPIGIRLSGASDKLSNVCHNTFININAQYTGDYGLLLEDTDNNTFLTVYTYRISGTGKGIGLLGKAGVVGLGASGSCRANYFYHVQGEVYSSATSNNVIYGYDRENGQALPTIETGGKLTYLTSGGPTQLWYMDVPISSRGIMNQSSADVTAAIGVADSHAIKMYRSALGQELAIGLAETPRVANFYYSPDGSARASIFSLSSTRLRIGNKLQFLTSPAVYANNAAALAGGAIAGDVYRTSADPSLLAVVY